MKLGNKIRKYRQLHDMSQKELGMKVGFSAATADSRMRKYESDAMAPKADIRAKIAEALNIDLEAISDEINHCKRFYRVPSHCMKWGRPCEYMGICRNFDPQMEYIGFERRKEYEAE
jgi:transcriptional regulator with XRE-family HTH domain